MLNKDKIVKVMNRENGKVGYKIPELGNLRRQFEPGEIKEIPVDELIKLSYIPGGKLIMSDYLVIQDEEVVAELIGEVEPEYYYKEKEIKDLLLNGSLEAVEDCLDFAPQGVLDNIKTIATSIELNDVRKRNAIKNSIGYDVTKAIDLVKDDEKNIEDKPKKRRVSDHAEEESNVKERRTTAPKYRIVR